MSDGMPEPNREHLSLELAVPSIVVTQERASLSAPHHHGKVIVEGQPVEYTEELATYPSATKAIIVPGFGGFKRTSRELRHAVAQDGMDGVSYDPLRKGTRTRRDKLLYPQVTHVSTIRAIHDDLQINEAVRHDHAEAYDLILLAHSMGGLAATDFALEHPDHVDMVVYLGSAGFGSPTINQLAHTSPRAVVGMLQHELVPFVRDRHIDVTPKNVLRVMRYYGSDRWRTAGEAASCLRHDMREKVKELGRQGIQTVALQFEHDIAVPKADVEACTVSDTIPGTGHIAPMLKPERVAWWISHHYGQLKKAA